MPTTNALLAVDPGLSLGWAYFQNDEDYPEEVGLIKPIKHAGNSFYETFATTVDQFEEIVSLFVPDFIAIEWPSVYTSSSTGMAAAGSGSVVKLAYEVGVLAQLGRHYGAEFMPVPVNEWKGQLPKSVIEKRIKKLLPASLIKELAPTKDVWDAIGIGLYVRGLLK